MVFWFSISICIFALGAQIYLRSFGNSDLAGPKNAKMQAPIFFISLAGIFGYQFYISFLQYRAWEANAISRFLLPPYQNLDYFLGYSFTRFFFPFLISLAAAIVFFLAVRILNKKYQERFFYEEEYWLGALGLFLSGYPGFVFYFIFLIAFFILIQLVTLVWSRSANNRLSLYYLWMPLTAAAIILSNIWFSNLDLWKLMKV